MLGFFFNSHALQRAIYLKFSICFGFKTPSEARILKFGEHKVHTDKNGRKWFESGNERTDGIYLFKVNNRNTRTRCEICSKLTIKPGVFMVSLLLTLNIFHTLS